MCYARLSWASSFNRSIAFCYCFFVLFTVQDFSKELLDNTNTEDNENNNFSFQDRVPLLKTFWNEPAVQTCFDQRNLFYIDDSAK